MFPVRLCLAPFPLWLTLALESERKIICPVCLQDVSVCLCVCVCVCAALDQAGSAPTEGRKMCLTYARHTRPVRLEQQDTINDHRIRLLQYGFPLSPTFFTVALSYFTDVACLCVFVACLCVFKLGRGPFILSFCCHSLSLAPLLMWVIDMQQCIPGSYRKARSHGQHSGRLKQARERVGFSVGWKSCNLDQQLDVLNVKYHFS